MRKFITYSYTILLTLTCLLGFPFIFSQLTTKAESNFEIPTQQSSELPEDDETEDVSDNEQIADASDEQNGNSTEDSVNEEETKENETTESETNENEIDNEETDREVVNDQKYEFSQVSSEYFDDALFIGDSRTVGLYEYGNLQNATFFANNGMSVYQVFSAEIFIPSIGKTKLTQLLESKDYSKIYIMLGINELGYDFNATIKKYKNMIETIRQIKPNAIIYVQGNLHVTQSRSNSDNIFNNTNINKFNTEVATLADNKYIFYLDVNELFDDANGNLRADYSSDNTHVLGKYYADWCDWLSTKAIQK